VVDDIGMKDLIGERQVMLVLAHLDKPGDYLLVAVDRHNTCLLSDADRRSRARCGATANS